jgi:long-subunit fatty acid transport protein
VPVRIERSPEAVCEAIDPLAYRCPASSVHPVTGILCCRLPAPRPERIGHGNGGNGDGTGWGVNAAVKYQSSDAVAVGLSYRSRIKVDLDGTAGVTGSVNLSNSANTNITLPDLIQFGVSYKASDNITLNSDIDYTMWSTYDRLVVTSNTLAVLTGGATDTKRLKKVGRTPSASVSAGSTG